MNQTRIYPIFQAMLAALLFGASAPLAKLLLGEIGPVTLAGLLYLGSGAGLLVLKLVQRVGQPKSEREARLKKADLPWLGGAVLAGGVVAPITLLFSLRSTPAATASLLLNFESVATTLIAAFVFKEAIGRRAWGAIAAITVSSILLSLNPNAGWGLSLGALGILAACMLWGIDNNCTRNISAKDPLTIVTIKGLGAGGFSLGMAVVLGEPLPTAISVLGALVLGSLSYGASIVLFIRAMRALGAARTSALFGTAPLGGMVLSFLLLGESPTWMFLPALPLMVAGTLLLVNEEHDHLHIHEHLTHEHSHTHHDGHHKHAHSGDYTEPHSHVHTHLEQTHKHDHTPDLHHRHTHLTGN